MRMRVFLFLIITALVFSAPSCFALNAIGLETDTIGRKWENHLFFERMENLTGIHMEGHAYEDRKTWNERLEKLRAGENADVLLKADLTRSEEKVLLNDGILIDLAPFIESCMPNFEALLRSHPEWKTQIALEDGRIASLPEINTESRKVIVWINEKWIKNLGRKMPESLDELTEILEAFRTGDPNGNGKQDEKPCSIIGMWELRWLLPYFGIKANDWMIEKDGQGNPFFVPESENYRLFTETMADWYTRGIIDKDTFTETHIGQAYFSESSEANVGLFVSISPATHVPLESVTDYRALLIPYRGKMVWRDFPGEIWNGCFAVTASCPSPEEALQWADALYAEEAAILSVAGKENEDWKWNEDGYWTFVTDSSRTVDEIRRTVVMNTGTKMPGLYPASFVSKVSSREDRWLSEENQRVKLSVISSESAEILLPSNPKRASSLISSIIRLTDEGTAEFITGEKALTNESWQQWLLELKAAGSEELIEAFGG